MQAGCAGGVCRRGVKEGCVGVTFSARSVASCSTTRVSMQWERDEAVFILVSATRLERTWGKVVEGSGRGEKGEV